MEKKKVRKEIIKERNDLIIEIKDKYNKEIFNRLINSEIYKNAKSIFIYISFGSEVDTKRIIRYALKDNKNIYVPKTDKVKKKMKAIRIHSLDNMIVDKWGILEPKDVDKNKIGENFDLIVMPGVAFDKKGNRIGYGGGYYDKYILNAKEKCTKVALAYDLQILDNIENEDHDIKVDFIVTNSEIIEF